MRAIQVFSSHLRMPVILAVLLACSLGSARAAVVFAENSTDAVINTVSGTEFPIHNFTVSEAGVYQATITDLSSVDDFFEAFTLLSMKITNVSTLAFSGPAGTPGGVASFNFTAPAAGSFVAMVKAISAAGVAPFSGYQVRVQLIPEPAVWVMLAAGFGLLGFVRIRRAGQNGV